MDKKTIYILGDICPRWGNSKQFDSNDEKIVFNEIIDLISDADLVIANLEAPATLSEKKLVKNSMNLKTQPSDLLLLKKAGIDAVSLANNHILDYGVVGLEDTICSCEEAGLCFYGAGTIEDAAMPHFINLNGKKIGILAFAEHEFNCAVDYEKGANLWDDLEGIKAISDAKGKCDYLIVQYHGGIEEYIYPSPYLQKKCRAMCEAGADLVTCQHSHCIGTREEYCGAEILYGQGNCIFGYEQNNNAWNQGLIIKIDFLENVNISYIPITASAEGEHILDETKSNELLDKFFENSKKLSNSEFIKDNWKQFCLSNKDSYLPMLFSWGKIANKVNRITKGKIISFFTTSKSRMNSMNLIRCDAHNEVMATILENDFYKK